MSLNLNGYSSRRPRYGRAVAPAGYFEKAAVSIAAFFRSIASFRLLLLVWRRRLDLVVAVWPLDMIFDAVQLSFEACVFGNSGWLLKMTLP